MAEGVFVLGRASWEPDRWVVGDLGRCYWLDELNAQSVLEPIRNERLARRALLMREGGRYGWVDLRLIPADELDSHRIALLLQES